jgi:flagellar motility protein MotE (MotC chaperone)
MTTIKKHSKNNRKHFIDIFEDSETYTHPKPKTVEKTMKKSSKKSSKVFKTLLLLALPLVVATLAAAYYIVFNDQNVGAQTGTRKNVSRKLLTELQKEQKALDLEKKRLEEYEQNLKSFEAELEQRYDQYLKKIEELKKQQEEFQKKIEGKTVDRQVIETYENIDPEQAAILMSNLYKKDKKKATLVMRKIAGKKAGKILEAMIPLSAEISTQLAKEVLEFYKPKKEGE